MTATPETIFKAAQDAARKAVQDEVAREPENPYAFDCGFAWVIVKPATGPFVNWCKRQIDAVGERSREAFQYGSKAYEGGWQFWQPGEFSGQSVHIHKVGADAFAKVLRDHGLKAHVGSRLD